MTDSVNSTLSAAEDLFQTLVWDNIVNAELAALFASVPLLAIWPAGPLITTLAHIVSKRFFARTRMIVDTTAIPFINAAHRKAFDDAAVQLQILAADYGDDSPEFKKAREDAKLDLNRFVRSAGA